MTSPRLWNWKWPLIFVCMLMFGSGAMAQVNSSVVSVPLQYTVSEYLTLSVTSGSPQSFPAVGGNATTPLVLAVNYGFQQTRHLTVVSYTTTGNALTGSNTGTGIGMSWLGSSSSLQTDRYQGGGCNTSPSQFTSLYPQAVLPPSAASAADICPAIFDGSKTAGTGNLSPTVTLNLGISSMTTPPPPDTYTGTLYIAASAL